MKIKVLIITLLISASSFAGVPGTPNGIITTDLNVMNKDNQSAIATMSSYAGWLQNAVTLAKQARDSTSLLDAIKRINSDNVRNLCTGCSDYTVAELENYKTAMSANWCASVANNLDFAKEQMTNAGNITNFLATLTAASAGGTIDPQTFLAAAQGASTTSLTSLNQTTQMMATQANQEKQENEVKNQIANKRMDYAITGNPNAIN